MPRRGYRKGLSDNRAPIRNQLLTRVTDVDYARFTADATAREVTVSTLLRAQVTAYLDNTHLELPQKRAPTNAAIRELARVGNNLNQLAKQANTGLVPVNAEALDSTLKEVVAAISRL